MLQPTTPPPPPDAPASSFEGRLDGFTQDGFIAGWARHIGKLEPVVVRILLHANKGKTEIIGEAAVRHYRHDLLEAGRNLGHCGFFARPRRPLPPGRYTFSVHVLPGGEEIASHTTVDWPGEGKNDPSLLPRSATPAFWTDEDVLAHLDQFDLAAHFRVMGAERFVDALYRFILDRWMDEGAHESYVGPLENGGLTPEELFRIILTSRERRSKGTPLPSPYDYRFPFHPPYRLGR